MNYKRVLIFIVFSLTLVMFPSSLAAETITLKNGKVLRGQVIGQTRTEIRLQTSNGLRVITKANIRRISYDSPAEIRRREQQKEKLRKQAEQKRLQEEATRKAADADAARKKQESETTENPQSTQTSLTYRGFALRNAVLPGWGFFANDQPGWGTAYAALTAGAVFYAYTTRQAALAGKDENFAQVQLNTLLTLVPNGLDSGIKLGAGLLANEAAYGPYQTKINRHNQSLQILGLVYIAQLAHTAALAPGWLRGAPGTVSFQISDSGARLHLGFVGPASGSGAPLIGAGFSLRF